MLRLLFAMAATVRAALRSRRDLVLENLALRQQLAIVQRRRGSRRRPNLTGFDRIFWVVLRRVWARWRSVLVVVQPESVVRWHRAGFRLYWTRLSRKPVGGRPHVPAEARVLIRRMAAETRWGAPRIP